MEQLIASFATMVLVIVAIVAQYMSRRTLTDINDAVNHRHEKNRENGDPPPKLFDVALLHRLELAQQTERITIAEKSLLDLHKKVDKLLRAHDNLPCNGGPPICEEETD